MNDQSVRQQLFNALAKRQAHQLFDTVVEGFPAAHYNTRPAHLTYSFWQLLEHMRITQWDILDYIVNPDYQYRRFPEDYWPHPDAQADTATWQETIAAFRSDQQALAKIILMEPWRDLYEQIPHAQPGHNILREIIIVVAHNSYHIGEFGILRGTMDLWKPQDTG